MTVKYGEMKNLISNVVSIDQYKPKIGESNETVVLAFEIMGEQAAKDLNNLIETDPVNILDCDISEGPNTNSNYIVFVEMQRNNTLYENIMNVVKITSQVSGITEWRFNFYKGDSTLDLNEENLKNSVLDNSEQYVLKYTSSMQPTESIERMRTLAGV